MKKRKWSIAAKEALRRDDLISEENKCEWCRKGFELKNIRIIGSTHTAVHIVGDPDMREGYRNEPCKQYKFAPDHIDRFAEVAKGLELPKLISQKLANFIHYEVITTRHKSISDCLRETSAEIVWWHKNWHRDTGIPCDGTMEVCKRAKKYEE